MTKKKSFPFFSIFLFSKSFFEITLRSYKAGCIYSVENISRFFVIIVVNFVSKLSKAFMRELEILVYFLTFCCYSFLNVNE